MSGENGAGPERINIVWLILNNSLLVLSAGLLLGLPLALGASRWLKSFLFGVPRVDPIAIGCAALLISAVALLASYLPSRRAATIDAMRALRHE